MDELGEPKNSIGVGPRDCVLFTDTCGRTSSTAAAGGILDPGRCMRGCSGAIEVPSELLFPRSSGAGFSGSGVFFLVGWLTDRWTPALVSIGLSGEVVACRDLVGEALDPRSDELRKWPFDRDDLG